MSTIKAIRDKFKQIFYPLIFIDYFSITPSQRITFNNEQYFKTNLGIFASWIVTALTIVIFFNFGSNMLYRKNPISIISQLVTLDPKNVKLTNDKFFFALGLEDLRNNSQKYIDESIYKVQIIKRTKIGLNFTLETLKSGRCNIDLVPEIDGLKTYYKDNQINDLICIKDYSEIIPELQGTWDAGLYKNMLINIIPCRNTTEKNNCKSKEIIESFFNNANFVMYFSNLALNPGDYEKPITHFGREIYIPISFSTLTYIEMNFQHLDFLTDNGLIFEDIESISTVNYASNRQLLTFNPNLNVQIDMKLDRIMNIYQRKYDKILEVIANIGGIIQILMIIMIFIVNPFIQLDFKTKLANSLFSFDNKELKNIKKKMIFNNNKKKISKITSRLKLSNSIPIKKQSTMLSKNKEELSYKEYFKNDNKKIEISYIQHIFSCFISQIQRAKSLLIEKGLQKINKTLDISYIISKLVELEKLKLLLLDKEQLELFDFIPKPKISLNEIDEDKKKSLHRKFSANLNANNDIKGEKAFKALKFIKEKEKKSFLDEKLINLISSRIKKNIDISYLLNDQNFENIDKKLKNEQSEKILN